MTNNNFATRSVLEPTGAVTPLIRSLKLAVAASVLAASTASAGLVFALPGGTTIPIPAVNYFGPGPQVIAPGIIWSSSNAANQGGSVFGYTGGYGFAANGFWDSTFSMIGVNDSFDNYGVSDTMTIAFSSPVSAVGGFLNYVPGGTTPATIAVYDSSNTLIESATLNFLTGGGLNSGFFYGFQEPTASISYFTLTDAYIGLTDLTTVVPEPSSAAVAALGLIGFGLVRRSRR